MRRLTLCSTIPLSVVLSFGLGACGDEQVSPKEPEYEARSLVAFGSCDDLVSYARVQIQEKLEASYRRGDHGMGMPGSAGVNDDADGAAKGKGAAMPQQPKGNAESTGDAAPKDPGHSGTNNQEVGVDEADRVKTDGRRIFSVSNGVLRIAQLGSGQAVISDSLKVRSQNEFGSSEFLIVQDRLLLIQSVTRLSQTVGQSQPPVIRIREIDVAQPGQAKIVREMEVEGRYISARQMGSKVRVALRSSTKGLDLRRPWDFFGNPNQGKDHDQPNTGPGGGIHVSQATQRAAPDGFPNAMG